MSIVPSSSAQELLAECQRRVALAREQVVEGNVPLRFRYIMSVFSTFGPRWSIPKDDVDIQLLLEDDDEAVRAPVWGWQRRAWNAVLCLEKVAPLWNPQLLPLDCFQPEKVDSLLALDLTAKIEEMKFTIRNVFPHLYELTYPSPSPDDVDFRVSREQHQKESAVKAATVYNSIDEVSRVVSADECHEFDPWIASPLDWKGDYSGILATQYCASAFSIKLDANKDPFLDTSLSKEFWLWWLDEAVPASWFLQELR